MVIENNFYEDIPLIANLIIDSRKVLETKIIGDKFFFKVTIGNIGIEEIILQNKINEAG